VAASAQIEYFVVDFGGAGDDIYEIDYMWLRNDHSRWYRIEYKDVSGSWVVLRDWTLCGPYEFIAIEGVHVSAAELKVCVRGSAKWDASWILAKVYGRLDPVTNFLKALRACVFAKDDLDRLRSLIREGGSLRLDGSNCDEMKQAVALRDCMHLRNECKLAAERRDLKALEELIEDALLRKMEGDVAVMMAMETRDGLVAQRDYVQNHRAYKFMCYNDIDSNASKKYLGYLQDTGYDCLFGLVYLVVDDDNGNGEKCMARLRDMGVRSSVHRERVYKGLNHVKLPRLDMTSLEGLLESMGVETRDVKKYVKALWTLKYDTVFDLFELEREMLTNLGFREGHVDGIMCVSEGFQSKFAVDHGD
jgi:hypothetical protein